MKTESTNNPYADTLLYKDLEVVEAFKKWMTPPPKSYVFDPKVDNQIMEKADQISDLRKQVKILEERNKYLEQFIRNFRQPILTTHYSMPLRSAIWTVGFAGLKKVEFIKLVSHPYLDSMEKRVVLGAGFKDPEERVRSSAHETLPHAIWLPGLNKPLVSARLFYPAERISVEPEHNTACYIEMFSWQDFLETSKIGIVPLDDPM